MFDTRVLERVEMLRKLYISCNRTCVLVRNMIK